MGVQGTSSPARAPGVLPLFSPPRRAAGPLERLRSTHKWGCRGRSPLPEREVSSHFSLPQGGPEARKTNYEWISVWRSMTCTLRFHSEISKCVMENLCVLLMKTHNVAYLFPPASFGGDTIGVSCMKTH